MLPILQLGPLALQLPGLLLIIGVWLASLVAERTAERYQLSGSRISNLIFYALIGGLIGARLGYVLRFLALYLQSPLGVFSLNPNTLAPTEGLAAALIVGLVYAQRAKLPLWSTLDVLAPGLALFMIFVSLTHLASGDAFGAESDLPWAIVLWGARRHPTQIYELLTATLILFLVLRLGRRPRFNGFQFLTYLGLAAIQRFLIEAFRGDSLIVLGSIRSAQLISLIVLIIALVGLHLQARKVAFIEPRLPDDLPTPTPDQIEL
jgi:phosphatidylglycerol:prolipoprotein diacylglycerol transferase